jgi:hypothetical protein
MTVSADEGEEQIRVKAANAAHADLQALLLMHFLLPVHIRGPKRSICLTLAFKI